MRYQNLLMGAAAFVAAIVLAVPVAAQGRGGDKPSGPPTNPRTARIGVWDNSTNPNNVMTYEQHEKDEAARGRAAGRGHHFTMANRPTNVPVSAASTW